MNREFESGKASIRRRAYDNSLRDQQAEKTREHILETLSDLLRSGEMEELSYPMLAKRSGVSVPTVYRYFPSRKALFDALFAWLPKVLKIPRFPQTLDELFEKAPEIFKFYHERQQLMRTVRAAKLLREVDEPGLRARDQNFSRMLEPKTRHLPPALANAIHAVLRQIFSFDGYLQMQERFGTGPNEACEATIWTLRTVLAQLDHDRLQQPGPAGLPEGEPADAGGKTRAKGKAHR